MCFRVPILQGSLQFLVGVFTFLSLIFCFFLGTPPSTDYPVDNYPVIVEQDSGHKVLIVQAYAYSKYVGNITVWFDNNGEYVDWEGQPILLDNTVVQGKSEIKHKVSLY